MNAQLNGVDISHWNGANAIKKVKETLPDIQFVVIKASEGRTYVDPKVIDNVNDALENHLLIGLYHYARPENNDPKQEAEHFLNVCASTGLTVGNFIMVLDYEGKAHDYGDAWAVKWLDYVYDRTGVKPLIYLSQSYVKNYHQVYARNYGLWVARYNSAIGNIAPWGFAAMWQHTSKPYDMNKFFGSRETWYKYCKPDKVGEPGTGYCGCMCECGKE